MPSGFQSLADIFNKEPVFDGLRKMIKESDVVAEFKSVFPDLEKVAEAVKVEKKVLFLKVENAAWRNELKYKETLLVGKINQYFKEERIKKIRFL